MSVIATTAAHVAEPGRARLAAAMAAIRAATPWTRRPAGWPRPARICGRGGDGPAVRQHPHAVTAAADLGERCAFELALIAPRLPPFEVPDGHTRNSWLRELVMAGAAALRPGRRRWPTPRSNMGSPSSAGWNFPGYFLVVHDITQFCRRNNILCQGRGSAAKLGGLLRPGVTAVDPVANELLFDDSCPRPVTGPDIDIDIESDLREQVIQYVYQRWPRLRRPGGQRHHLSRAQRGARYGPGAGVLPGPAGRLSNNRWSSVADSDLDGIPEQVVDLAVQIRDLPRHMGIHSGGMVICDRPIADVCRWNGPECRAAACCSGTKMIARQSVW